MLIYMYIRYITFENQLLAFFISTLTFENANNKQSNGIVILAFCYFELKKNSCIWNQAEL